MMRQSVSTGRTFSTSSIHRDVIHAHGQIGSNQNWTFSRSSDCPAVLMNAATFLDSGDIPLTRCGAAEKGLEPRPPVVHDGRQADAPMRRVRVHEQVGVT